MVVAVLEQGQVGTQGWVKQLEPVVVVAAVAAAAAAVAVVVVVEGLASGKK